MAVFVSFFHVSLGLPAPLWQYNQIYHMTWHLGVIQHHILKLISHRQLTYLVTLQHPTSQKHEFKVLLVSIFLMI